MSASFVLTNIGWLCTHPQILSYTCKMYFSEKTSWQIPEFATILSFWMNMRGAFRIISAFDRWEHTSCGTQLWSGGKTPQYSLNCSERAPTKLQPSSSYVDISDHIVLLFFMFPELLVGLRVKERLLLMKSELPRPLGSYLAQQSQGLISKDKVEFALFPYCEIWEY